MTQRDDFGNFLGSVLRADASAIQEMSAGLDPVTRERLADKLSLLRDMMLRPTSNNNNNNNNNGGGCNIMEISLSSEPRSRRRRFGSVTSQYEFAKYYVQSLKLEIKDKAGNSIFEMTAADTDSTELLLQIARDHLHGVQVLRMFTPSNSHRSFLEYNHIETILNESFQLGKLEELEIIGSFVNPVADILNRILDEKKTKSNLRRLSLNLNSRLGENAARTLARWISCEEGQSLERLELHESNFSSEAAIVTFCDAISRSTSLRQFQIDSHVLETMADPFTTAMRENQSLVRFTSDCLTTASNNNKGLLQAFAEKTELIKDFSVAWEDTNNFEGVDLAIVPMLQTNSLVGGFTFLCADRDEPAIEMPAMQTFFRALGANTSLESLAFVGFMSLSKETMRNLWDTLRQNETLDILRFVSWSVYGSSIKLPDNWEHEFVFSVLPSLSVTKLELTAMNLSTDETLEMWKNLALNQRLNKLSIADLQSSKGEWEQICVEVLPTLPLRQLFLPNFRPKVAGWDKLLKSMEKNVNLETFECSDFRELKCYAPEKDDDAAWVDYEKEMMQKLDRFLLLNKAGRKIEPAADKNPSLCPLVLDRINRLLVADELSLGDVNKESIVKAGVIYDFLQGPFFNPILVNGT
jgi:hypothetical protein